MSVGFGWSPCFHAATEPKGLRGGGGGDTRGGGGKENEMYAIQLKCGATILLHPVWIHPWEQA